MLHASTMTILASPRGDKGPLVSLPPEEEAVLDGKVVEQDEDEVEVPIRAESMAPRNRRLLMAKKAHSMMNLTATSAVPSRDSCPIMPKRSFHHDGTSPTHLKSYSKLARLRRRQQQEEDQDHPAPSSQISLEILNARNVPAPPLETQSLHSAKAPIPSVPLNRESRWWASSSHSTDTNLSGVTFDDDDDSISFAGDDDDADDDASFYSWGAATPAHARHDLLEAKSNENIADAEEDTYSWGEVDKLDDKIVSDSAGKKKKSKSKKQKKSSSSKSKGKSKDEKPEIIHRSRSDSAGRRRTRKKPASCSSLRGEPKDEKQHHTDEEEAIPRRSFSKRNHKRKSIVVSSSRSLHQESTSSSRRKPKSTSSLHATSLHSFHSSSRSLGSLASIFEDDD